MPFRERLLLTVVCFAAMAALFLFIACGGWLLRKLGIDAETALLVQLGIVLFGLCFAMTFLSGAPRWFRKRGE